MSRALRFLLVALVESPVSVRRHVEGDPASPSVKACRAALFRACIILPSLRALPRILLPPPFPLWHRDYDADLQLNHACAGHRAFSRAGRGRAPLSNTIEGGIEHSNFKVILRRRTETVLRRMPHHSVSKCRQLRSMGPQLC